MSWSVISAMPSRYTSPATTRAPNAIDAMIAAFAAASYPSTSAVGSRSAYPSVCASAKASWKEDPSSVIRVRMKLVVPFTMPITRRMRSPASDSRRGRMRGMPPATEASSSLLAVTTGLPAFRASVMRLRAGSIPPITSTTTSMSGSVTTASASCVNRPAGSGTSRSRARFRTATRFTSRCTPARCSIRSAFSPIKRTSAEPTFPQPSKPTRTVSSRTESVITPVSRLERVEAHEILGCFAPDDAPRATVSHEHDRGPGHLVVVGRHRVAVCAGDGHGEEVPHLHAVGKAGVRHHEVALFTVLSGDGAHERARRVDAVRQVSLVPRAVQDRAGVVAHSPVDGDVRQASGDRFHGPDPVQRDRRRTRDRPTGLDHEAGCGLQARTRRLLLDGGLESPLVLRDRHGRVGGEVPRRQPAAHVELL